MRRPERWSSVGQQWTGGENWVEKPERCVEGKMMSTFELEQAVKELPPQELNVFAEWFEEFIAARWDERIERDIAAGRLAHLAVKADEDFEAARCSPL